MTEFGEALKLVFAKLAGFFDIIDLSFFISGVASAGALATFAHYAGVPLNWLFLSKSGIFIVIVSCYILGLVSFATGRFLQYYLFFCSNKSDNNFKERLRVHKLLEEEPFKTYLATKNIKSETRTRALKERLWAEIRQSPQAAPSLVHLNSYWVKAATLDGLIVSILLWGCVAFCSSMSWVVPFIYTITVCQSFVITTLIFCTAIPCIIEARNYRKNLENELVATIAATIYKLR